MSSMASGGSAVGRRCRRLCGPVLGLLVVLSFQVQAAEPPAVVNLPPFLVEQPGRPLPWRYAEVPGMELLTTCSDPVAQHFIETCLRQEELVRTLIPARYLDRVGLRMVVLLIDADEARRMADETLLQVMADKGDAVRDRRSLARIMPNLRIDDRDVSAVLTLRQPNTPDDLVFGFATSRIARQLERMTPAFAPWMAAGLVGLYDSCTFSDRIRVDPLTWRTADERRQLLMDPDWPRDVLPLPALFGFLPDLADPGVAQVWREQATLFVRWALVADGGARAEGFWRFVDRYLAGEPTEAAFRRAFGFGMAEARDQVSDYLPRAVQEEIRLPRRRASPLPRANLRPATPVESGRIRAEWERLEVTFMRTHHPDLADKYLVQARTTLERARRATGNHASLRALSGLLEYAAGGHGMARVELEAALAAGETRPHAAHVLARLRYDEAVASLAPGATLNAAQAGYILGPLQTALRGRPALPEAYLLLTEVWLRSTLTPTEEDLEVLRAGVRLFPVYAPLVGRTAAILIQQDRREEALAMIDASLARIPEQPRRAAFEELRRQVAGLGNGSATRGGAGH